MKALVFDRFGGPEVLQYREVPDPDLQPGCALVRTRAIGLNFADVYRRKGTYHLAGNPPWICGYEAAGEVLAVDGPGATVGQRVGFADSAFANAEVVCVPVEKLIPLPEAVSFETAAGVLLQGLTAQYLVRDSHRLQPGQTAVVHAAAGGVGLLLVQLITHLGGRAIALASTEEKRQAALGAGAVAAVATGPGWVEAVRAQTAGGQGAEVVYDSVGATLLESCAAARMGGTVVFFGMAGGDPQPIDPRKLMDRSLTLTGGDLWNVLRTREDRLQRAEELLGWVASGSLSVRIARRFPLSEGAAAHSHLEGRGSIGKVLLIP